MRPKNFIYSNNYDFNTFNSLFVASIFGFLIGFGLGKFYERRRKDKVNLGGP